MDGYIKTHFQFKTVLFLIAFLSPFSLFCPIAHTNSTTSSSDDIDLSSLIRPENSNPGYDIFNSNNIFINPKTGYIVDSTGKKVTTSITQPAYKPDYTLEKTILKEVVKIPFGREKASTKAIFSGTLLVLNTLSQCNEILKAKNISKNPSDEQFDAVSFWTKVVSHYASSTNPSVIESIKAITASTNAQLYGRKLIGSIVEFIHAQALRGLINKYGDLVVKGKTPVTLNSYADALNNSFKMAKNIATGTATSSEKQKFKIIKKTTSFLNSSRKLFRNKKITINDMPEALQGTFLENKDFITAILKKSIADRIKNIQNATIHYAQKALTAGQKCIIDGVEYLIEKAQSGSSYIITEVLSKKQLVVEQLQSLQESCLYSITSLQDNAAYFIQTTKDGLQQVSEYTINAADNVKTTLTNVLQKTGQTITDSSSAAYTVAQAVAYQAVERTTQGITIVKDAVIQTTALTAESIKSMSAFAQTTAQTGGSLLWNSLMAAPAALIDGISSFTQTTSDIVNSLITPNFDLSEVGAALEQPTTLQNNLSQEEQKDLDYMLINDTATFKDLENKTESMDDDIFEDALDYFTQELLPQETIKQIIPSDLPTITDATLEDLKNTLIEEQTSLNLAIEETSITATSSTNIPDLTKISSNPEPPLTVDKSLSQPSLQDNTTIDSSSIPREQPLISLKDIQFYEQEADKNKTREPIQDEHTKPTEEFVL